VTCEIFYKSDENFLTSPKPPIVYLQRENQPTPLMGIHWIDTDHQTKSICQDTADYTTDH